MRIIYSEKKTYFYIFNLFIHLNSIIMKKNLLKKISFTVLAALFAFTSLDAQKTVTVNVPADGATIHAAITTGSALIETGDELIVAVPEGVFVHSGNPTVNWGKKATITIAGAGAGKTILKSSLDERPVIGSTAMDMLFNVVSGTGAAAKAIDTSTIVFKDLTIKNFGGTEGTPAAGSLAHISNRVGLTLQFVNVIFDSNVGFTLFNSLSTSTTWIFENCLFINNAVSQRSGTAHHGIVNSRSGGNLTIKNSTFISNDSYNTLEANSNRGSMFYVGGNSGTLSNLLIENNAFINNQVKNADVNTATSVFAFLPGLEATEYNVTLKNNIAIGNSRADILSDYDLVVNNPEKITLVASGNLFNTAVKTVVSTDEPPVTTYEPWEVQGITANRLYTYTHPDINFEMDGNLPKLIVDEAGIGHVNFGSTSIDFAKSDPLKIYALNSILKVEGLREGSSVEIYTITGSLYFRTLVSSDNFEMEMPKGIFIVRSGINTRKVLIH
jgi:hypothetical protein